MSICGMSQYSVTAVVIFARLSGSYSFRNRVTASGPLSTSTDSAAALFFA